MAGASAYWWDRKVAGMPAINAAKTHCKHGHDLADSYVRENGWRRCKTCQRAASRRTKQRVGVK